MSKANVGCVAVRSLHSVFAPVGSERLVTKQEAAALIIMGNAEYASDPKADKPAPEPKQDKALDSETETTREDLLGGRTPEVGAYNRSDLTAPKDSGGPARKTRH